MHYGIYLPNFGAEVSALALAKLAKEAETAGWDGFFMWDQILESTTERLRLVDPWITLTAIGMNTERIKFGSIVTPIARRRPWKLARETSTLDNLSGGRLILGVGLGDPPEAEFEHFGEETENKVRAVKLDEGLDILVGLWRGKPFSYQGKQYKVKETVFVPTPMQLPRIPIWVGGFWPNKAPFRRAARWDGVIPLKQKGMMTPDDLRDLLSFIQKHRISDEHFDVVIIGSREKLGKGDLKGIKKVAQFAEAGATWWLEDLYTSRDSVNEIRSCILLGPPRED
jgi:alkanesulfonate monooxygenase SsuD/methylene tetrahydromethanopterin reductase-like flavin-dependent oxidoreductase (luciferase family)